MALPLRFRLFFSVLCAALTVLAGSPGALRAEGKSVDLVPFQLEGKETRQTTIDLAGLSRCMFGDMDALLLELKTAQGTLGVQLSVERIGGGAAEVYFGEALEKMSAPDIMGSYRLKLPPTLKPKVYGVFLCTITQDKADQAPCSAQLLKTSDELFAPYRVDTGSARPDVASYKPTPYVEPKDLKPTVFYAQFFVVDGKGAYRLSNTKSSSLEKSLIAAGFTRAELGGILSEIKRFTDRLNSLPLEAVESRLQMPMPYYDQARCLGAR